MITVLKLGIRFYSFLYNFFKKFRLKNKVVFISRQGDAPSLDFRLLARQIRRDHPDWEVVIMCRFIGKDLSSWTPTQSSHPTCITDRSFSSFRCGTPWEP